MRNVSNFLLASNNFNMLCVWAREAMIKKFCNDITDAWVRIEFLLERGYTFITRALYSILVHAGTSFNYIFYPIGE